MSRIHGKYIIRRRNDQKHYQSIQSYTENLKEDFHGLCGYCGKDMNIIPCPAEKDHLIPESLAEEYGKNELITDYYNLVYACKTCNQKKKKQWPFNHINFINDGNTGYVDPATDEYDNHLEFDSNGKIIAKTSIGQYMYNVFDFKNRLTEVWFRISQIQEQLSEVDSKIQKNNDDTELLKKYWKLKHIVEILLETLKKKKESC